ncbi:alcohol dehydrogenase catalytic domain-containing protein [Providencia rettgeri]
MMKAAVLNTPNGLFSIENIEIDHPKGREVLVEVKASGLCHTDLHIAENNYGFPLPAVLGHELAGIVKEIALRSESSLLVTMWLVLWFNIAAIAKPAWTDELTNASILRKLCEVQGRDSV